MSFWKLTIKYSKMAIPDVILFSNKPTAEYYKEQKEKGNPMVRWTILSDEPIELPVTFD
jgi:hypothetical protein